MKINKLIMLLLLLSGSVQYCFSQAISGQNNVCPGTYEYRVNPHLGYVLTWSVSDPSLVNSMMSVSNQCFISWNASFTSGCSKTVILTADYGSPYLPMTMSVTIKKSAAGVSGIYGPSTVVPSASFINEYPELTFSIIGTCLDFISWTIPAGWSFVSGQNQTTMKAQPGPGASCTGQVTVSVSNSCGGTYLTKDVSLYPLALGTLSNLQTTVNSLQTLEICPDDEVIMDAASSIFCNTNTNIYLGITSCGTGWTGCGPEDGLTLTSAQYALLGGLSALDMRKFYLDNFSKTFAPGGHYKIKLAVGGGATWNERAYTLKVKPAAATIPIVYASGLCTNCGTGAGTRDVDLIWSGSTTTQYEIMYEHADNIGFPVSSSTISGTLSCGFPAAYGTTPYVYRSVTGLPAYLKHFRYKIRECVECALWSNWIYVGQLTKKETTGMNDVAYNAKGISLFPNPVKDNAVFTFETPTDQKLTIELFDISGKSVLIKQVDDTRITRHEIDLSTINRGIYFIKVLNQADASIIYSSKLVKE